MSQEPIETQRIYFGQIAVELGLLHPDELTEVLELQRNSSFHFHLGQVCRNHNYLSHDQVQAVLTVQKERLQETYDQQLALQPGTDRSKKSGKRILIMDDSAVIRYIAKVALEKEHEVTLARSGTEAVRIIRENGMTPFELIILDIVVPGISGFEVARIIREEPGHTITPILFISVLEDAKHQTKVDEVQAVGLFPKPGIDNLEFFRNLVRINAA